MAVKDVLLGIMTLGSAYGLQLHSELCSRAPHRARTNVGQIYGTLERLVNTGLVIRSGLTSDGLPLYTLTEAGEDAAESWLTGNDLVSATEWPELLDRVLIARSLSDDTLEQLVGAFERILSVDPPFPPRHAMGNEAMFAAANVRFANAALGWLGDIRRDMSLRSSDTAEGAGSGNSGAAQGYQVHRPKRGRPTAV